MKAKTELKVLRWGNSLAIRLPFALAEQARLFSGQTVTVEAIGGMVIVKPIGRRPQLALAQKLKRFDPALHGVELLVDGPMGREVV